MRTIINNQSLLNKSKNLKMPIFSMSERFVFAPKSNVFIITIIITCAFATTTCQNVSHEKCQCILELVTVSNSLDDVVKKGVPRFSHEDHH